MYGRLQPITSLLCILFEASLFCLVRAFQPFLPASATIRISFLGFTEPSLLPMSFWPPFAVCCRHFPSHSFSFRLFASAFLPLRSRLRSPPFARLDTVPNICFTFRAFVIHFFVSVSLRPFVTAIDLDCNASACSFSSSLPFSIIAITSFLFLRDFFHWRPRGKVKTSYVFQSRIGWRFAVWQFDNLAPLGQVAITPCYYVWHSTGEALYIGRDCIVQ